MKNLDLLLIKSSDKTNIYGSLSNNLVAIEPPLWAALIASYIREKGFTVSIIDAEADGLSADDCAKKISDLDPLLTCFVVTGNHLSASTWNMTGARNFLKALKDKNPDRKIILWGLHPSSLPERTLKEEETDFVCQGEGFYTLEEFLKILKKDPERKKFDIPGLWYKEKEVICPNPRAKLFRDLDELPRPAWDLLPMEKYRAHNWHCFSDIKKRSPYGVIYTSLGCPFNCKFCALRALFGGSGVRYRSPEKVIGDIEVLVKKYNVKNIKVLDECFVLNEKHVIEICDLIIQEGFNLNIWAYARIDTIKEKILKKLKKAGFNWLCYGIETGSEKIFLKTYKGAFTKDDVRNAVRATKDAGISVVGNFMFGLPDDDFDTMKETLDFAKELNCEYTNFYATMAYPGSLLYEEALKNNTRLPDTWRGYSAFSEDCLPLPTKYLSSEDVLCFRDKAFYEFHNNPEYIRLIENKFGEEALKHIKDMLKLNIKRRILKNIKKEPVL